VIAAGSRLGVYELIAPLGSGGMGEVYRARDMRLGRDVALKVLPSDLAANPSSLARFEQEARHVAGLNHPNIVAVFDVGSEDGVAYIVTELVDGVPAARRLVLQTADPIGAVTTSRDGARLVYSAGPVERDLTEYSGVGTFIRTIAASSLLEGFPSWARAGDRFVYRVGGPGQSDSLWLGTMNGASVTLVQLRRADAIGESPQRWRRPRDGRSEARPPPRLLAGWTLAGSHGDGRIRADRGGWKS